MNVLKETAQLRDLWEAMDIVIGATSQTAEPAPTQEVEDEDIQPILARIERR